ncbi:MAG: co-chaperone GroES [Bacillota bacterium]
MSFKPLADRVLIKVVETEERTKSGIVIPDTAKEKPEKGKVLAVGPGKMENGQRIAPEVKVGDVVYFAKYAGTTIKIDGDECTVLKESDILGIE